MIRNGAIVRLCLSVGGGVHCCPITSVRAGEVGGTARKWGWKRQEGKGGSQAAVVRLTKMTQVPPFQFFPKFPKNPLGSSNYPPWANENFRMHICCPVIFGGFLPIRDGKEPFHTSPIPNMLRKETLTLSFLPAGTPCYSPGLHEVFHATKTVSKRSQIQAKPSHHVWGWVLTPS